MKGTIKINGREEYFFIFRKNYQARGTHLKVQLTEMGCFQKRPSTPVSLSTCSS
jgi:hypothetical protein